VTIRDELPSHGPNHSSIAALDRSGEKNAFDRKGVDRTAELIALQLVTNRARPVSQDELILYMEHETRFELATPGWPNGQSFVLADR
jgi:hypothetical protein